MKNQNKNDQQEQGLSNIAKRKAIISDFKEKFYRRHPWYKDENYKLPSCQYPTTLQNVELSRKEFSKISLDEKDPMQSDIKKSILCGTVSGDTSLVIQQNYANARMQNRHSTRQSDWFFWKWTVALKQYVKSDNSFQFSYPDGFQANTPVKTNEVLGKLKVASKADKTLTAIWKKLIAENKKTFDRSWLNHQNNYFLMTLWLDDGSLVHQRQGEICVDWHEEEEKQKLVDYLKVVWGIETVIKSKQIMYKGELKTYRHLYVVNQTELLKLLRLIAPIVPVKSMLYKILFVPANNIDLLQRWASECESLVLPQFKPCVNYFYRKTIKNYGKIKEKINEKASEEDIVQLDEIFKDFKDFVTLTLLVLAVNDGN
ncbi:MAG: hypothetical protein IM459_17035 [Microcystis sp. M085S1]|nr:hypothetical protein [Microcystis sp. M085S1]